MSVKGKELTVVIFSDRVRLNQYHKLLRWACVRNLAEE